MDGVTIACILLFIFHFVIISHEHSNTCSGSHSLAFSLSNHAFSGHALCFSCSSIPDRYTEQEWTEHGVMY